MFINCFNFARSPITPASERPNSSHSDEIQQITVEDNSRPNFTIMPDKTKEEKIDERRNVQQNREEVCQPSTSKLPVEELSNKSNEEPQESLARPKKVLIIVLEIEIYFTNVEFLPAKESPRLAAGRVHAASSRSIANAAPDAAGGERRMQRRAALAPARSAGADIQKYL